MLLPTLANLSLNQTAVVRTDAAGDDDSVMREIVLVAVTQNGNALRNASAALQNDREIVLAAVTQDGRALKYASEELRNDREVVLAAVTQDGTALGSASEALWADREIVLAAVAQNGEAFEYALGALKNDFQVRLAAATSHRSPNLTVMGAVLNDIERELNEMRSSRMDRLEAYSGVLDRLAHVKVEPQGPLDLKLQELVQLINDPKNDMHVRAYKRELGALARDDDAPPPKQARVATEMLALSTGQSMRRACVFWARRNLN